MRLKLQLFALKKNMVAVNDGVKTLELKKEDKKDPEKLGTVDKNVAATPTTLSLNGVDQDTQDKMNSTYNPSKTVKGEQADANKYLGNLKAVSGVTDIIDQGTWDALNTPFQSSSAYQEAYNYTQQLLQQLSSGRTSYTDQINSMMDEIMNREKFSYDVDSDMLFQQYLASSMASGKMAMQDTMGQAAALTGGYGSTYATAAGNQQYNAYIQDAYNNLPEYYNMALEAYQMEGEEMYKQLSMLNDADRTEYERLFNSWSANNSNAQQLYQNEYNAWQDSVNNAYNSANLQLNEQGQIYDQAYNTYNAVNDHAQQAYQNEYTKWADEVSMAYEYAGMQNSDYWKNQSFIEEQRQYNENLTNNKNQFAEEMAYKKEALKQDQAQFNASQAAKKEAAVESNAGYDFSTTEINGIKQAYIDAGGGQAGYEAVDAYLMGIGKFEETEEFQKMIDTYIGTPAIQEDLPVWSQTWSISKDTKNWFGNDDNNDKYVNLDGDVMKFKDLKKAIMNSSLTKEEKDALIESLRNQSER